MIRVNTTRPWMISSMWCYHSRGLEYCSSEDIDARQPSVYMTVGPRPILLLLLLAGSLPAGLYAAALLLYSSVTLFSCVTLIRKLQSTSDLDHFHARELPCSHVKSHDDPISDRRADSAVPYSFIYIDSHKTAALGTSTLASRRST